MYNSALFLLSFLMPILIGCTVPRGTTTGSLSRPSPPTSIPLLRSSVQKEESQFENPVRFLGIQERHTGNPYNRYFLRSWVNKTSGEVNHQLYVSDYYSGSWAFWTQANSQDAQPLEFVSISRDVVDCGSSVGCLYSEHLGVTIPDTTLKAHQNSFAVKFYAKTGKEMVITLTSLQIRQQLKAIDDFQAAKKN
jgi:hypothetical protein